MNNNKNTKSNHSKIANQTGRRSKAATDRQGRQAKAGIDRDEAMIPENSKLSALLLET